ncbi:pyocin knob domain-containing protein [Halobacillus litoralis]|uniref:Uncharacterized protein n=1 Tax=Halobacillus litoralis TaxID=45668 RepID=A0A410MCD3_9BACI|nr:pyocin knob domain-containing protein [Halobacillus litoralis]QAS52367.1 hypothetical protein HLI_09045 [Halobacillus litoralis]
MPNNTNNLDLYMVTSEDPKDEMYFNVTTMLNENWEKIDQTVETKDGAQTKANDAEQAAIDYAESFGLGTTANLYSGDFNNLYKSGFYYGQTAALNRPGDTNGFCIVTSIDTAYIIQVYFPSGGSTVGNMYKRICSNGVWSSWVQMETTEGAQTKATEVKDWAKSMGLGTPSRFTGNLDNVTTNGFFYIGTDATNQPTAAGYLIHQHHPGMDYASQIYIDLHNQDNYMRTKVNGTWNEWAKIAVDSEVVHKSGDKMTGDLETDARIWHGRIGVYGALGWMKYQGDGTTLDYGTYIAHNAKHDEDTGEWTFERSNVKATVIKTGHHSGSQVWESTNATMTAGDPITWDKKTIETTAGAQAKADAVQDWAKSFGLGSDTKQLAQQTDVDTLDNTGFYDGFDLVNAPTTDTYSIIHIKVSKTAASQVAIGVYPTSGMNRVYTRTKASDVWEPWKEQETTAGAQAKANAVQDWAESYGLGTQAKRIDYHVDNVPNGAGFYYLSNGNLNGSPSGSNGYLIQQVYTSAYKKQLFMDVTTNKIFHRFSDNNGWRPWAEIANQGADVSFASVTVDGVDLKQSVSNGKQQVRDAVIGKGGTVADADSDGIPTFQELTDGVNGITTSAIKSVQRGNNSGSGYSRIVTISPVDLSKSIVLPKGFHTSDASTATIQKTKVLAKFNTSSEIELSSANNYNTQRYFSWEVIEFQDGVNVQSGYIDTTLSALNVTISAVDMNKAAVFYSESLYSSGLDGADVEWALELTDATTLNVRRGDSGQRYFIQWFVVEFP